MKRILVVANETIAGSNLIEAVRRRLDEGDAQFVVCVPRTRPREGNIIYDDFVHQAAQVRIDLARKILREEGIADAIGEVGDPDPYTAAMDAIAEHNPDEVIVSTFPATTSGWLRRDLVDRIRDATDIRVEHVVSDIDSEGLPFRVTLVVANRTATSPELLPALKRHGGESEELPHLFIVVVPQEGGEGIHGQQAAARLAQLVDRMRADGLLAAGMIGPPDPYIATMNAAQFFRIDDVVISTLPETRSRWLRQDLIERVRKSVTVPVEHIVSEPSSAAAAA